MCEYGSPIKFHEVVNTQPIVPYIVKYGVVKEPINDKININAFRELVSGDVIKVKFIPSQHKRNDPFNNETSDRAIKKCRRK